MSRSSTSALRDGVILNNRYRIVKQIGRGGFGRAYLAEDTQRYRELCVLKEFAPQVESNEESRQAEDLFEREAGILYQLSHQQIPRFEALLRTRIDGRRALFLVQEYIKGESYWELLQRRGKLSEAEVTEMIWDILPVLDYIHTADLIHRDISPDNLILRDRDLKAVLIDFGCIKLAANAVSQTTGQSITLIGKPGYAPDEQMRRGLTMPCSDLYALAATAVVLLTGKQPDKLYDSYQGEWKWQQIEVSSHLKRVLQKMLADRPCDRYESVAEVSQILAQADNLAFPDFLSRIRTLILAPGDREANRDHHPQLNKTEFNRSWSRKKANIKVGITATMSRITRSIGFFKVKPWQWGIFGSAIVIIPGLISFALINQKITQTPHVDLHSNRQDLILSQEELDFQLQIEQKVKSLKLDTSAFYQEVDGVFHEQYPELAGKKLTEGKKHKHYREVWYRIAKQLLVEQKKK
ncbi:MAG: protein kinase domain-containing protein [Waterburya sp.]